LLIPGDKAESHPDWLSYSELDQPDVTPVSNVIKFSDREGGEITGLDELFGIPVVMKRQSIRPYNTKADPADPTTWYSAESIHNIGNIPHHGYISVQGSLYVCSQDGIYRLSPNNLAASDSTPTEHLKITGPIEDAYDKMTQTQKEEMIVGYNQQENEIVWTFGKSLVVDIAGVSVGASGYFEITGDYTDYFLDGTHFWVKGSTGNDQEYIVDTDSTEAGGTTTVDVNTSFSSVVDSTADGIIRIGIPYAFNILRQEWREIDSARTMSLMTLDADADLLVYDGIDKKVYSFANDATSTDVEIRTKTFPLALERSVMVRDINVRYQSDDPILLELFSDLILYTGALIEGRKYRIQDISGGVDFTTVGAGANTVGTEFICNSSGANFDWGGGSGNITVAATRESGSKTLFTTSAAHGLKAGYVVRINGCTETSYNDSFVVEEVPTGSTTTFVVEVPFVATDTGTWSSNGGKAVQVSPLKSVTLPAVPKPTDRIVTVRRYCKDFNLRLTNIV
jgi:hypothetical protein